MSEPTNQPNQGERSAAVMCADLLAYPETKESDMEGVWTNGSFTIEWVDEDRIKVSKEWGAFREEAVLCGGDFETVLETLFMKPKIHRINY